MSISSHRISPETDAHVSPFPDRFILALIYLIQQAPMGSDLHSGTFDAKIRFRDLEFTGRYVERRSTCGVPYPKWEPSGVPRIPDKHLNNVFYLYRSVEAAEAGEGSGGTGFLVTIDSVASPGRGYVYAVSNYHVAVSGGYSVIRLNLRAGGVDIIDLGPEDWEFDAQSGTDIAIARVKTDATIHNCPVAPVEAFVTPEKLSELDVGPGDGVFMIGRFIDHDGGPSNQAAARFGHISIMPTPLKQEFSDKEVETFCVDMNSRTGYSGSPVWVYRTAGSRLEDYDFATNKVVMTGGSFLMLLGIHYGQFPEFWKIVDGNVVARDGEDTTGSEQQIRGMSGMTCVLPAWRIRELLDCPKFQKQREESEREIAENTRRSGRSNPSTESAA